MVQPVSETKYIVVFWYVPECRFVPYTADNFGDWKGLNWEQAKLARDRLKSRLNFPHNPDINGIEIHSEAVCRKHGIID